MALEFAAFLSLDLSSIASLLKNHSSQCCKSFNPCPAGAAGPLFSDFSSPLAGVSLSASPDQSLPPALPCGNSMVQSVARCYH